MKRLLLILSIACIVGSAFGEDQSLKSYVDMGLPSGTLWKSKDEPGGLYSQTEAMEKFGDKLPTEEQIRELVKSCKWTWDGGTYTYKVVGPNGKSIIFKATGTWPCEPNYKGFYECDRSRIILDNSGGCWSSSMDWHENYGTYYHLYFDPGVVNVYTAMSICGIAVRLVDKGQSNLEEKVAERKKEEERLAAEQAARERREAEVEKKAKIEKEKKAKEQKAAREREAKEQQERQRKAQERAEKDKRERAEAYAVLGKILKNPLGVQYIKWSDSKSSQKKAILEKYPQFSVSNNYKLSGRVSGLKYYYDISSVSFDLSYEGGTEVFVSYAISAPSVGKADLTATNIHEDLKKYGFRMSSYNPMDGESSCKTPTTINGVTYNWVKMSCSGSDIIIKLSVSRKTSNSDEYVVHDNTSSSSNTSYTHSAIRSSSSSSNYRGTSGNNTALGDLPTNTEIYICTILVDVTQLPAKKLKLKLSEKAELFPITYEIQVGSNKIKCLKYEFTGEVISSAVPTEIKGNKIGAFMEFEIQAKCKIGKNYPPELRQCIWIKTSR